MLAVNHWYAFRVGLEESWIHIFYSLIENPAYRFSPLQLEPTVFQTKVDCVEHAENGDNLIQQPNDFLRLNENQLLAAACDT